VNLQAQGDTQQTASLLGRLQTQYDSGVEFLEEKMTELKATLDGGNLTVRRTC
jgi:hypothetical protein